MGIDPGLATTGYGVIETAETGTPSLLDCGTIRTPADYDHPRRLAAIHTSVRTLLERFDPDSVSVEKLFFSKNAKTAFAVGEARGVIVLAFADREMRVAEYTPLEVKKTLTGNGSADKGEVQKMVMQELRLDAPPRPDDAADALALGICHTVKMQFRSRVEDP